MQKTNHLNLSALQTFHREMVLFHSVDVATAADHIDIAMDDSRKGVLYFYYL